MLSLSKVTAYYKEFDYREKETHNGGTLHSDKRRTHAGREHDNKKEMRRDPLKSNKDIELDKLRAKRDSSNKALAEKEKAIKTLLDSDNVVPPGTEGEAIQDQIVKNQQKDLRNELNRKRNCSKDRNKSPPTLRRSPISFNRRSPKKISPIYMSPERRRKKKSGSTDRRKGSNSRENSEERRESSRQRLRER